MFRPVNAVRVHSGGPKATYLSLISQQASKNSGSAAAASLQVRKGLEMVRPVDASVPTRSTQFDSFFAGLIVVCAF